MFFFSRVSAAYYRALCEVKNTGFKPSPSRLCWHWLSQLPGWIERRFLRIFSHWRKLPKVNTFSYLQWVSANNINSREEELLKLVSDQSSISLVAFLSGQEQFFTEGIESLRRQIYSQWELVIVASPELEEKLRPFLNSEPRIKLEVFESDSQLEAFNRGLEVSNGDFVVFLSLEDVLAPQALMHLASVLDANSDLSFVYADEDSITEDGVRYDPFFKPSWSPELLLSQCYLSGFFAVRKSLALKLGGFDARAGQAYFWDFVLRLSELAGKVAHIPDVLYHRRQTPLKNRFLENFSSATDSQLILEEALERRFRSGYLDRPAGNPGHFQVTYSLREEPLLSVLIPFRDGGEVLNTCLESLFALSSYRNFEVIGIDNQSSSPETLKLVRSWQKRESRFSCHRLEGEFNFSLLNNFGVEKSEGDFLLFLNSDTQLLKADSFRTMLSYAQHPELGVVGARLLYPNGCIQHAGCILGLEGLVGDALKYLPNETWDHFGRSHNVVNVSAVSAACMMCRKEVFLSVSGFDETLPVEFNDIDFCLRVGRAGFRNLSLPHAIFFHFEAFTRGGLYSDDSIELRTQAAKLMWERWGELIDRDPFYNPNLWKGPGGYRLDPQASTAKDIVASTRVSQVESIHSRGMNSKMSNM